jgi:hypothetical protein
MGFNIPSRHDSHFRARHEKWKFESQRILAVSNRSVSNSIEAHTLIYLMMVFSFGHSRYLASRMLIAPHW